jgi:heat shock protein HslJ
MKYMLIFLMATTLGACSSSRNSSAELTQLGGDWVLTVFPYQTKALAELFPARIPELQLEVPGRKVTGNTGCNRMFGSFTVDGSEFHFGNMGSTKMVCPGYDETIYMNALGRVNRFSLNNDQLTFYQDSTVLMTFTKKTAP